MLRELIEIVSAGLSSKAYGVNVEIDALVTVTGDAAPKRIKRILTVFSDTPTARGEAPRTWPALIVSADGPGEIVGEVMTQYRDGKFPIAIEYFGARADTKEASREIHNTMRAILRTLTSLSANAQSDDRKLNNIQLVSFEDITFGEVETEASPGVSGALVLACLVRECNP